MPRVTARWYPRRSRIPPDATRTATLCGEHHGRRRHQRFHPRAPSSTASASPGKAIASATSTTPRPGRSRRGCRSPPRARSTPRSGRAKAAFPGWAATPPAQRARILFRYRDLVEAHRDELARHLRLRARQDPRRRPRLGHPRHRGRRVRLRDPPAPQGRDERERRGPRGQLQRAPAARRVRRHHPVQLPGHGSDVDVPDRARLRQHLRAEAVGEGPVVRPAARRARGRGRGAAPGC